MKIGVTSGTGQGKTRIAAFDNALWDAGIANYNLIRLSSVIPENSDVVVEQLDMNEKEHGHKLYVVLAECFETEPGMKAVAGLGWVTANHKKGKGIFVEHFGRSREEVADYIESTIKSMTAYRPEEHGETRIKFAEKECTGDVACALVIAVYKSEGWE
jgi:arginine decarboxylase